MSIFEDDPEECIRALHKINAIKDVSNIRGGVGFAVAKEFMEQLKNTGKTPLVVSTTWDQIYHITNFLRGKLMESGHLNASERRTYKTTMSTGTSVAQRKDPSYYYNMTDLVAEVFGEVAGVPGGYYKFSKWNDDYIVLENDSGRKFRMAYSEAEKFDIAVMPDTDVCAGERLLMQGNLKKGSRRILKRGELVTVKKILPDGTLALEDGREIPTTFKSWTHGYAITTYAAQGATADSVIFSCNQSAIWYLTKEDFYVGISRGRESVKVFTDNFSELQQKIGCSGDRLLATELVMEKEVRGVSPTMPPHKEIIQKPPEKEKPVVSPEQPAKAPKIERKETPSDDRNDNYMGIGY